MSTDSKKIKYITLCPLFAALTAVCSQIQIPLPYVPLNLALFAVYMAGSMLGPVYGSLSIVIYVLLGACGVPVFAGFAGGLSKLTGMTGGYIIGYILAALISGIIIKIFEKKCHKKLFVYVISFFMGMIACYTLGTAWFMYVSGNGLMASLSVCVFPFLIADAVKIALAAVLTDKLKKINL